MTQQTTVPTMGTSKIFTKLHQLHGYAYVMLLLYSFFATVYLGALVYYRHPFPFVDDFQVACIVTVIYCLLCVVATYVILRIPVWSFQTPFLAATVIYTLSDPYNFFYQGEAALNTYRVITFLNMELGLVILMLAYTSFMLGTAVAYARPTKIRIRTPKQARFYEDHLKTVHFVALGLYVLSALIVAYYTAQGGGLMIAINGGYSGEEGFFTLLDEGGIPQGFSICLLFMMPWMSLILLSTSNGKLQYWIALFACLLAIGCVFLMGSRTNPSAQMALVLVLHKVRKLNLRWTTILLGGMAGYFVIAFLPYMRATPIGEWDLELFTKTFNKVFGNKDKIGAPVRPTFIRLSLIGEGSFQTLMGTVERVPHVEGFRNGVDYIRPLIYAFPFSNRFLLPHLPDIFSHQYQPGSWITTHYGSRWAGLGYMQVAEAYLQFGAFGIIGLYSFLAYGFHRLWNRVYKTQNLILLAFFSVIIHATYAWVRNDAGGLGRATLYSTIAVFIIPLTLLYALSVYRKSRSSKKQEV